MCLLDRLYGDSQIGAVGRAAAIPASGAAGVGGHPVQGAVYSRPVYGLPAGHKWGPHGDLAVGYMLAGLAGALRRRATAQRAGIAEDAAGAERVFGSVHRFFHAALENIYTFFLRGVLEHHIINSWNIH